MTAAIHKKIDQAYRIFDLALQIEDKPLILANSGGKDSLVLYHLAKSKGYNIPIIHSNTTIDPPGTLGYIRRVMPETAIIQPKLSFLQLIEKKAFPVRRTRYCCEILKENFGKGKAVIEGVRADEGNERKGRDYIQCDSRAKMKGTTHIYPIYDFTTVEIWQYIIYNDLEVAPCYYDGMNRLGCVGCPLASVKNRRKEFEMYPKFRAAITKAITRGMAANPQWKISQCTQGGGDRAFEWWLSGKTMNEYFKLY